MNKFSSKTKKMLALALVSVMTVSVVGCGKAEPAETTAAKAAASTAAATAAAAQTTPAPAAPVEEELYYNKEGFPIVKEPITIDMAGTKSVAVNWQETHTVEKIEEMMGIKLNCIMYENGQVVSTNFATQITSDTLPDLMANYNTISKAMANEYGGKGYLLNLADYLDIMPNFAAYLEANPEFAAFNTAPDGGIYSIDRSRDVMMPQVGLYVSKADQEKYGFSVSDIKTVDDFYEVLKSIKEQNPDITPYGMCVQNYGMRGANILNHAFGIEMNNDHGVNMPDVDENGQVYLQDISENKKAAFAFQNKLWEEDLVEKEGFVQTVDEFREKVRNGQYVFWYDWSGMPTALGTDAGCYKDYDMLACMTSEYQSVATYNVASPYNTAARMMVSAKTKYPEAICRLLDYMFTEEGFNFFYYGTEGETYDWVTNEIGEVVPDFSKYYEKMGYGTALEMRQQELMFNTFSIVLDTGAIKKAQAADAETLDKYINDDPTYAYTEAAFMEKAIREQVEVKKYLDFLTPAYTDEESKTIAQPNTDMQNLLKQYRAQFITGELDVEKDWDAYVEQINVFWQQMQPAMQAAYDRMNGK